MKKTKIDSLIMSKALRQILDVNAAMNVKYGKDMYSIFNGLNGLFIQKVPEAQRNDFEEGIFIIEPDEFDAPFSMLDH